MFLLRKAPYKTEMNKFTYETVDNKGKLETYEWDNIWWEHTEQENVQRILYIGDSISCGIRPHLNACVEGQIFFHGIGTSKAVDNPFLMQTVELFAKQPGDYKVILFNNGLHGWHQEDESEYKENYKKSIISLKKIFPDSRIVIVMTTCVSDEKQNVRIRKRNESARGVAEEEKLDIIDLYAVSEKCKNMISVDGVHFDGEGYLEFAKYILKQITD